jgi:hypothetical protein
MLDPLVPDIVDRQHHPPAYQAADASVLVIQIAF